VQELGAFAAQVGDAETSSTTGTGALTTVGALIATALSVRGPISPSAGIANDDCSVLMARTGPELTAKSNMA